MDTTTEFPIEINHRYQLGDCVSNIVTFKCVSGAGDNGYMEQTIPSHNFQLVVC